MEFVNLGLTRNVTISLPVVENMFRILTVIDIVLIYVDTKMFPRVRTSREQESRQIIDQKSLIETKLARRLLLVQVGLVLRIV